MACSISLQNMPLIPNLYSYWMPPPLLLPSVEVNKPTITVNELIFEGIAVGLRSQVDMINHQKDLQAYVMALHAQDIGINRRDDIPYEEYPLVSRINQRWQQPH